MILLILNLLVTVAFIYFMYLNAEQTISIFWIDKSLLNIPLYILLVAVYVVGQIFATLATSGAISIFSKNKQQKNQNKYVEKISVDKESAELKVQVLEEKIKTLEVALMKALKKD